MSNTEWNLDLDLLDLWLISHVLEGKPNYACQHNNMSPQIDKGVPALFSVQLTEPNFGLVG